jgi:hypothetical protein
LHFVCELRESSLLAALGPDPRAHWIPAFAGMTF